MKHASNFYFPLLVMLMLTLLVGITTYEVTVTWQDTAEKTARRSVQAVILTNIRWGLYEVQNTLVKDPAAARIKWEDTRVQARLLNEISPDNPQFLLVRSFLDRPENIRNLDWLSRQDYLNVNLSDSMADLNALADYSRFVTLAVTTCMLILGGVLIGITAWDLRRLITALLRSRDLNVTIQEEERRRIAQELHDGVLQDLIALKRQYSEEKVTDLVESLRRVCHNLKPQVLEDLGLSAALEFLADDLRQSGIANVQVTLDEGLEKLPRQYELPLFRVVQELCSNIKNHAQATQVSMTIAYNPTEGQSLSGSLSDNGQGFDPQKAVGTGMGLAGVRERIEQLDGRLKIESSPGGGSRFQFVIPVHQGEKSRQDVLHA